MGKPTHSISWINLFMLCVVYIAVIEPEVFAGSDTVVGVSVVAMMAITAAAVIVFTDIYERVVE